MKKIILLFAMMLAVAGVQAYDKNIDLSSPATSNATWNASTCVLSFTSSDGYAEFPVESVDTYTSVEVLVTANSGSFRIKLMSDESWYEFGASSKETAGTAYGASNLKQFTTNVVEKIGTIKKVKISLATGESGSVTIPLIIFKGLDVNSNTEGFGGLSYTGTQANLLSKVLPLTINQSGFNFVLGNASSKDAVTNYLDVSDYHAIYFEITDYKTANVQLRANIGTSSPSDIRYAYKVGTTNPVWATENAIAENGWYYIDLSDVSALRAISTQSLGSASERFTINQMYLVKKNFAITDGKDAGDIVYDPVRATVAYNRTFSVGQKSTACLPFALSQDEANTAGTFYEYTGVTDGKLVFTEVTSGGTTAYKPYIFKAASATPFANLSAREIVATPATTAGYATTDGESKYTFQGVLAHTTVASGVYGFNSTDGVFSKTTTADVTIDAFRAYIIPNDVGAHSLDIIFSDGSGTTGIKTVEQAQPVSNVMYNLQGQRVSEDHKGLVIVNGRKMMVK